jgi:pimeloyl-ACP methyl ester carboxylesterase
MDRRLVEVAGASLEVEVEGAGEAMVLIHGFAGDRRSWDGIAPGLALDRRVVRYDLRGYGGSVEREPVPFRHARDLAALLDALDVRQCVLAGVSMGGAVALNFALDHPDRVRRLVLVSPGLVAWEWSDEWRAAWRKIVEAARKGDLDQARGLWWEHPLFATTRRIPQAAAALRDAISAYSGAHWALGDHEELAMPDVDRLGELAVETLLVTGSSDLPDFQLIAGLVEAMAPGVRRITYEDAGHMLHLERPAQLLADMKAFLAG